MEGWRQRRLGSMGTIWQRRNKEEERKKEKKRKNERKGLTLTGLLMEGPIATLAARTQSFFLRLSESHTTPGDRAAISQSAHAELAPQLQVARTIVVYLKRAGGQSQYSALLELIKGSPESFRAAVGLATRLGERLRRLNERKTTDFRPSKLPPLSILYGGVSWCLSPGDFSSPLPRPFAYCGGGRGLRA
jgi:hypothetical protein